MDGRIWVRGLLICLAVGVSGPLSAETWADRAERSAKELLVKDSAKLAADLQRITHPSGRDAKAEALEISKERDLITVKVPVRWKGGFTGGEYVTTVGWIIGRESHVKALVTSDTAAIAVAPANLTDLDQYFREKLYPPFLARMAAAGPLEPEAVAACETSRVTAVVMRTGTGDFAYAAWNKPKKPGKPNVKPDLVLEGGTEGLEGSGACAHRLWRFTNGDTEYQLSELGCTEEEPPEGSIGQLSVFVGGDHKATSWCKDPAPKEAKPKG